MQVLKQIVKTNMKKAKMADMAVTFFALFEMLLTLHHFDFTIRNKVCHLARWNKLKQQSKF